MPPRSPGRGRGRPPECPSETAGRGPGTERRPRPQPFPHLSPRADGEPGVIVTCQNHCHCTEVSSSRQWDHFAWEEPSGPPRHLCAEAGPVTSRASLPTPCSRRLQSLGCRAGPLQAPGHGARLRCAPPGRGRGVPVPGRHDAGGPEPRVAVSTARPSRFRNRHFTPCVLSTGFLREWSSLPAGQRWHMCGVPQVTVLQGRQRGDHTLSMATARSATLSVSAARDRHGGQCGGRITLRPRACPLPGRREGFSAPVCSQGRAASCGGESPWVQERRGVGCAEPTPAAASCCSAGTSGVGLRDTWSSILSELRRVPTLSDRSQPPPGAPRWTVNCPHSRHLGDSAGGLLRRHLWG